MTCQQCKTGFSRGAYTSDAQKQSRFCPDCWRKSYHITSVCRGDLEDILSAEALAKLDDDDMARIAGNMADAYTESGFWIDLKIITEQVIEDKQGRI